MLLPATTLLLLLHLARGQGGNSKRGAAGSRVVGSGLWGQQAAGSIGRVGLNPTLRKGGWTFWF